MQDAHLATSIDTSGHYTVVKEFFIDDLRTREREDDTARFYLKRKKLPAARGRLEKLLELYPGSSYSDQARELLEGLPE